jgi:hypothetical protein
LDEENLQGSALKRVRRKNIFVGRYNWDGTPDEDGRYVTMFIKNFGKSFFNIVNIAPAGPRDANGF